MCQRRETGGLNTPGGTGHQTCVGNIMCVGFTLLFIPNKTFHGASITDTAQLLCEHHHGALFYYDKSQVPILYSYSLRTQYLLTISRGHSLRSSMHRRPSIMGNGLGDNHVVRVTAGTCKCFRVRGQFESVNGNKQVQHRARQFRQVES